MAQKNGFGRRDLIKGVAGASLATALWTPGVARAVPVSVGKHEFPKTLLPYPLIKGNPSQESFWSHVRQAFPLPENYIHMNTGTTGSQPWFSLNNLAVYNRYKSLDPRDWQTNLAADFGAELFEIPVGGSHLGALQADIADMYGANADEIVLSYNTTDASNLTFVGIPWKPGDRIVTTQMEHPAYATNLAWARDVKGVTISIVDIPSYFDLSIAELVALFEAKIKAPLPAGATQWVMFSEIPYKNGLRLPAKEICAVAHANGAFASVDSAHGWGHVPVNCHDYGADFIQGAGHKWLCGGPGTGIFYVRNSGTNLPPFQANNGFGNLFVIPSVNYNNRNWKPASLLQGRGEANTPALYAMADSARFFNYVGVQNIYNRGVALATYLQSKVVARWGPGALSVSPTVDPRYKTFLTGFNPFKAKNDPAQLATMNTAINTVLAALAANSPKIYIRSITWRDKTSDPGTADNRVAFRISTHAMYNSREEIDVMFAALVNAVNATGLPQGP